MSLLDSLELLRRQQELGKQFLEIFCGPLLFLDVLHAGNACGRSRFILATLASHYPLLFMMWLQRAGECSLST